MIAQAGEVLIIDADASIRGLLATLVKRLPRRPVLADDGNRAMELLSSSREFDAIILELMLTGLSGLDLLSYLGRARPELLGRVVVVTTTPKTEWCGNEITRVAAILRKPFAVDELQSVLRRCCEQKSGDQRL